MSLLRPSKKTGAVLQNAVQSMVRDPDRSSEAESKPREGEFGSLTGTPSCPFLGVVQTKRAKFKP